MLVTLTWWWLGSFACMTLQELGDGNAGVKGLYDLDSGISGVRRSSAHEPEQ